MHFKNKIKINSKGLFVFCIIILTIIRMWLFMNMPLVGTGQALYDDTLMVKLANSIISGEWLGKYNYTTLVKGVSYPLFLALSAYLNIPYLMLLGLLYISSILIFLFAFKKYIKKKRYFLLIYSFILFSPAMFTYHYVQRVYRMSLIPSQVLLVISCFCAMYFRRKEQIKCILPWAIGAGISLSFFWVTREDSIWIAPFVLTATVISCVACIYIHRKEKNLALKKVIILLLPLIMLICSLNVIESINYKYYGLYGLSDLKDTYFSKVIENVYLIDQNENKEYVWVNRDTLQELYNVSPTLATVKEQVEIAMDRWSIQGVNSDDKEVEKDYFMWALRDGVQMAGYYSDAKETNEFYKKVNDEILQAFKDGRLKRSKAIKFSSLSRPFKNEYIVPLIQCSIESIDWVIDYQKCKSELTESEPPNYILRQIEAITSDYLLNPTKTYFACRGWIFTNNGKDVLKAEIVDDCDNVYSNLNFIASDDVYSHFYNKGYDYESARNSRFDIIRDSIDTDRLFINIYINNELVDKIDLNTQQRYFETEQYKLNIDNLEIANIGDANWSKGERNTSISNKIINLYKHSGNILAILGMMSYIILSIYVIYDLRRKRYQLIDIWIVLTGIVASFILIITGVSYNYFEAWNRKTRNVYLAGAYPLIQIFISISLLVIMDKIKNSKYIFKKLKRGKNNETNNTNTVL